MQHFPRQAGGYILRDMATRTIYLDHHATTPMLPEVWDSMRPFVDELFGNPSSAHFAGRKARQSLEDAREKVASLIGSHADEVIFTSGATEANNLALFGLVYEPAGHLIVSPVEHPCVSEPLKHLSERGFALTTLPVDHEGRVEITSFAQALQPNTQLVSVMRVNHETGVIQPIRELATVCPPKVLFHCDAAQAFGKIPVNFHELGVSALTLSAHKFGGPKGIGALILKRGAKLRPQWWGGHQQNGRRPGTESVALAVGLSVALEAAVQQLNNHREYIDSLRTRFVEHLTTSCSPIRINGSEDPRYRVPHVVNVSFPSCAGDLVVLKLDLAGVACSTGSACSSGSLLPSPVLKAMNVPDDLLRSAVRFSFGPSLTHEDIDLAADRVTATILKMRMLLT